MPTTIRDTRGQDIDGACGRSLPPPRRAEPRPDTATAARHRDLHGRERPA
nr:hypothetical protein [Angustibacter aerolatus]